MIWDLWPLLGAGGFPVPPYSQCAPGQRAITCELGREAGPWASPAESESLGLQPSCIGFNAFSRPFLYMIK